MKRDGDRSYDRTSALSDTVELLLSFDPGDDGAFAPTPVACATDGRRRAGIDDLHFHDTRAEALTRLSRKLDVMQLARVSGHRDLRQLLNTYYREDPADLVDLLD